MDMNMIEVDPKLFVTCRLCLIDLGQYQIVPSVQQQIKYCFDIDVEPFDGLPQLLCTKCNNVLLNFYAVKKTFQEKQNDLKSKLLTKSNFPIIQPQQDTVSSSQQPSDTADENDIIKVNNSKKRKRVLQSESSCSDNESEKSFHYTESNKKSEEIQQSIKNQTWEDDYKKQIVCKLCNSPWITNRSVWSHIRSHKPLKTKYKDIFIRQCSVKVTKFDEKPNITGTNNMVVHSNNKIVQPSTSDFYLVYSKINKPTDSPSKNCLDNIKSEHARNYFSSQDSSDDSEGIVSKRKKRKRRLLSKSSNETVVIESNKTFSDHESTVSATQDNDEEINNEQCINIDSSDSDSDRERSESSQRVKQPIEAKLNDYKIIQGIINMCVNAYNKKNDTNDTEEYTDVTNNKKGVEATKESQLKHKLLSIGRKVINKQGFNCTGLLRYMEHKNLDIIWMPPISQKETCVRILTKLRGHEPKKLNQGWTKIIENVKTLPSKSSLNDFISKTIEKSIAKFDVGIEASEPVNQEQSNSDTAILYFDNNAGNCDLKKLLNANPVANPKQLPKKVGHGNEIKPTTVTAQSVSHISSDIPGFCMPIITSTTSLATAPNKDPKEVGNKVSSGAVDSDLSSAVAEVPSERDVAAPRIKVKPVSELMSEKTLNSLMKEQSTPVTNSNTTLSQIENVWPNQRVMNVFVPNIPQMNVTPQPIQLVPMPCVNISPTATYNIMPSSTASTDDKDYVILDTVELPNTKTDSPFKYLKDLLQIHNIILLNPCDTLTPDFFCLIKFKVLFKQEPNKDQPVVLCLSLLCFKNCFCLKVRDRNQQNIDINRISANWQWEILQIYRGEVVGKVVNNAQKISKETYEFTNNFFCLLKSITCKKPVISNC